VRIGVDLAISKSDTADYTAMVTGWLYEDQGKINIYVLPDIINEKMTFPETVCACKTLNVTYHQRYNEEPIFVIEDVGYQKALPEQLEDEGLRNVETTRPGKQDKRSRVVLTGHLIKSGKVLFPRKGCERLIEQLVHFGVEKHDDLADAFSNLVLNVIEKPPHIPYIYFA
jgi:predicted phage terminase large subunit-like protein